MFKDFFICYMWVNMPKHTTLNHTEWQKLRNRYNTHMSWAPSGTTLYTTGQIIYPYWCSITKPLSCVLPWVWCESAKQTRQFRLKWSVCSDLALPPWGYPGVPLSRCGKAECWMGYPIAPAWLLGRRLPNQSQIGLWTDCYEYIFLRLHMRGGEQLRTRLGYSF